MGRKLKIHKPLPCRFDDVLNVAADGLPYSELIPVKPFVKWVGGKRSIIKELEGRLPKEYTRYYEIFVGGGALFFAVQPHNAYLADTNFHLILTYLAIRDDVKRVIRNLKIHKAKHCKEYYLKARVRLNIEADYVKVAALLIYLNKTCYNGLYRVNKSGGFNVPIGNYKNPVIVDGDNLHNVSNVIQNTEIVHHSFEQTPVEKKAFYYIDPPYHETYSNYSSGGFDDTEHEKLAHFCHKITNSGGYFMLSNSNAHFIRTLYKDYCIETVSALRSVSCKADQREKKGECIIRNYK